MPLPPSRKDVSGPPPRNVSDLGYLVRHHDSWMRRFSLGGLGGRFVTPSPNRAEVFPDSVGDDEGGDASDLDIGFINTDAATASSTGTVTLELTYEPIDGSLHIRWNGIDQPPTEWELDGQTVTFTNPHIRVGDKLTAAYAYWLADGDSDTATAVTSSLYLSSVGTPNLWLLTPSSEYGAGFSDIYGAYSGTLLPAGVGVSFFFYIVVRETATNTVVVNYVDNASFWTPDAAGAVTKEAHRTGMHANTTGPVVIGGGFFANSEGPGSPGYHAAQDLPQDNPDGRYGLTDMDKAAYYWGEKIAETGDGLDDPIGPIAGAP